MKTALYTAIAVVLGTSFAIADEKPSAEEAAKIKEVLSAMGYTGGEYEKESEASGVYEIDDAKGASGKQYDIKLDKDFNLLSITAD